MMAWMLAGGIGMEWGSLAGALGMGARAGGKPTGMAAKTATEGDAADARQDTI